MKAFKYFLQDNHIGYVYLENSGLVAFESIHSGIRGSMWHEEFYPLWHGEWEPINAFAGLKIKFDPNATKEGWDPDAWTYIPQPATPAEAYRIRY